MKIIPVKWFTSTKGNNYLIKNNEIFSQKQFILKEIHWIHLQLDRSKYFEITYKLSDLYRYSADSWWRRSMMNHLLFDCSKLCREEVFVSINQFCVVVWHSLSPNGVAPHSSANDNLTIMKTMTRFNTNSDYWKFSIFGKKI